MVRLLFLVLLVSFIQFIYSWKFSKTFDLARGKTVNGPAPSSTVVSTTHCTTNCLQQATCVAVVYHKTSRNCYLLSSTESLVDTSDLGYIYVYVGGGCMDGWIEFEGSCYLFENDTYSWTNAREFCHNVGAELVEIETSSENVFIKQTLASIAYDDSWIGMTDIDQEGVWVWASTGTEAIFLDWGTSQPNNGITSNCGAIWESFGYRWVDEPCTKQFHPICEQGVFAMQGKEINDFLSV